MPMKNPPHPGEVIRDAIENGLGLTVTAAAEGLGVSRNEPHETSRSRDSRRQVEPLRPGLEPWFRNRPSS